MATMSAPDGGLSGNEALRQFMERLAVSNVGRYIEFPMIAVMGDTSSGKSSLLTSISGVELPSSEKLTTRCPIMLQMQVSGTKSAKVTVEWKETPTGKSEKDLEFAKEVDGSSWHKLTGFISAAQVRTEDPSGKRKCERIASSYHRLPRLLRSTS